MTVPNWVQYGFHMGTNTAENDLGQRVDGLRAELGMTVLDLAHEAKIPLTTLQRRLAGDGRLTVAELNQISHALRVTPASWFEASA